MDKIILEYPYLENTKIIVDNKNLIYFDTNNIIRNIELPSSQKKWTLEIKNRLTFLTLQIFNEFLFIGGNYNNHYYYWIVDKDNGDIVSSNVLDFGNVYYPPIIKGNEIILLKSSFQVVKCNILNNICSYSSVNLNDRKIPNNLLLFKDDLYTTVAGELIQISLDKLEVKNTFPLEIEFQGLLHSNFIINNYIIIPGDKEILIFDLNNQKLKCRYSFIDDKGEPQDYICGINYEYNWILLKTLSGRLNVIDVEDCLEARLINVNESPLLCESTIHFFNKYILNSDNNKIDIFKLDNNRYHKTLKAKKISPFISKENKVFFINSKNELCSFLVD